MQWVQANPQGEKSFFFGGGALFTGGQLYVHPPRGARVHPGERELIFYRVEEGVVFNLGGLGGILHIE